MASRRDRIGLDSSFLIPLLSGWHEHHSRTLARYEQFLEDRDDLIVPVQGLLECYSVLTRLPVPYRSTPEAVKQAIEASFYRTATIVGLTPHTAWSAIDALSHLGLGGGRVYDAAIAGCVAEAGAKVVFTWNVKHFLSIAPPGLEVRSP